MISHETLQTPFYCGNRLYNANFLGNVTRCIKYLAQLQKLKIVTYSCRLLIWHVTCTKLFVLTVLYFENAVPWRIQLILSRFS